MKIISFAVAVFLTAGFCKNPDVGKKLQLFDNKWFLVKIQQPDERTEVMGRKAFILFNKDKNSAGGNGGCNSFGSSVKVSGNDISISGIISTKMYCEGVQQTEDSFFRLLAEANRFEIRDKNLMLFKGKELLLEFESE
jgi:heat shock protein HslJ